MYNRMFTYQVRKYFNADISSTYKVSGRDRKVGIQVIKTDNQNKKVIYLQTISQM